MRHGPLAVLTAVVLALAGCGDDDGGGEQVAPVVTPPPAISAPASSAPVTAAPSSAPPAARTVELACTRNEAPLNFTVVADAAGQPDFTEVWAAKPDSCDVPVDAFTGADATIAPSTPAEQKAYERSGYDDGDMTTLYTSCAEVDPQDVYIEPGFTLSAEQVSEMNGVLALCPKHPHAKKWTAAKKRGEAEARLQAQGRVFGDGTYRVGEQVKPGTYVARDVDGCYWERQDRNGETIDNNFTNSAKRVQVTIRASDYGFSTRGCGTWRPA
jgi:hypothetical protein